MKRVGVLLITVASLAFAAPASAHTISAAQAYSVANSLGQNLHRQWHVGWQDNCDRQTPWRYSCSLEVWTADNATDCTGYFDVVSPYWGYRLRTENWSGWAC
jgi:hypothetical protein